MEKYLDFEKQKIHDLILKNPGIYISKIAELINMKISQVEQYLKDLELDGIIITTDESGFKRYYINDKNQGVYASKISDTRKNIYELISTNPGLYLSEIAEKLSMRVSLAEYHLTYLERNNVITTIKEEGYRRYYIESQEPGAQERKILGLLRQEMPLKIVLLLLKHKNLQHKKFLDYFDVAPSTLSYHLNKLLKLGVIEVNTYGKEKGYSIKNRRAVIGFLTSYKLISMAKSFGDMWSDINYKL